ncbi:MAG TPA: TIGR03790 family protein [Chthoniobacteraceae bacterium]|jgi:uncharacterized protein (TIGR03790 family)|nr:TIGR03790 family protein [Chthoniobacteraceae bacterium]
MLRIVAPLFLLLATVAWSQTSPPATAGAAPDYTNQIVVVYNESDPDSLNLARYYASKRNIPKEQLVGLKCPMTEEISRNEYDETIARPLREAFEKNAWWKLRSEEHPAGKVEATRMRFVALMRGMPLKIKPHFEKYEGDKPTGPMPVAIHNEASVDSELSILGVFTRQMSGVMNNPYFRSFQRIGESPLAPLLLVCRLDAPTVVLVRQMIDDSLAAEEKGLRGIAYIDARGTKEAGLVEGDKWILNSADVGRRKGMPVVLDSGEGLFPVAYPMSHAAVYFGWYSEAPTGPFIRPDFRFEQGAIAAHIHSFSAATLRDSRKNWCAPLLAAGAAATVGNVYEPFLGLTTSFDVMFERLQAGFTFGESCYMAQRFLSWMPVFVGDPLYRPFAKIAASEMDEPKNDWDAYRLGARVWYDKGPADGTAALKASAQKYSSGIIMEGLGLLQLAANDSASAVNSFDQATSLYRNPTDILRATIHEVFQLKALNKTPEAIALARKQIAKYVRTPGVEVLKIIEADMTVAAGTTTPKPVR